MMPGQMLLMRIPWRPYSSARARIDDAVERLNQYREVPAGSIRLSVPHTAALHVLLPRLREFSERYPDISLEISADNGFVDIIQDGFDAGIRLRSDVPRDMVAVPISPPVHVAVVASPDYLEQHGTPMTPADLQHHLCINRRLIQGDGLQRWEFMQDGRLLRISVPGKLVLNDTGLILAAALDGQGLFGRSACGGASDGRSPGTGTGRFQPAHRGLLPVLPEPPDIRHAAGVGGDAEGRTRAGCPLRGSPCADPTALAA